MWTVFRSGAIVFRVVEAIVEEKFFARQLTQLPSSTKILRLKDERTIRRSVCTILLYSVLLKTGSCI